MINGANNIHPKAISSITTDFNHAGKISKRYIEPICSFLFGTTREIMLMRHLDYIKFLTYLKLSSKNGFIVS